MKAVSVIVPTFNRSNYICDAIDSILLQENVVCEIIVVDDNGENSQAQLQNYNKLERYINQEKIKYLVHKTNRNGSAARNTGIRNSSHEYIAFLDDDDWFDSEKLSQQVGLMLLENNKAALCGFARVYERNTIVGSIPKFEEDVFEKLLSHNLDTCAGSSLVIHKSIIDEIGYFDEDFERFQDLEFLYRVSKVTEVSVVNSKLVNIRMHDGNTNFKNPKMLLDSHNKFLDKFKSDIYSYKKGVRNRILDEHTLEIAKAFLKHKEFNQFFYWMFKSKNILRNTIRLLLDLLRYPINVWRRYGKFKSTN